MSSTVRARYLAAMGLLPPMTLGLAACPRTALPDAAAGDGGAAIGVTSDARTAAQQPSAPPPAWKPVVRRSDAGGGVWDVAVDDVPATAPWPTRPPGPTEPRASCPSGLYCVRAPSQVKVSAPAPFLDCEAKVPSRHFSDGITFRPDVTGAEREEIANACCYSWFERCPGGRPLRADGSLVLAPATPRADWASLSLPTPRRGAFRDAAHERLAAHWLAEAAAEHASVASFSRFSLQLLALGARPDLVKSAHEAALDEIRHAQQCYALAARYSEQTLGPGPLELPTSAVSVDPAVVALETLRDGCLGESLASRSAAVAAGLTQDAEVGRILAGIAADEEAHAELAWRTLSWLHQRDAPSVRQVIVAFEASLSASMSAGAGASTTGGELTEDEAHGVLSARRRLAVQRETVLNIVLPCLRALLDQRPGPLAS